MELIENVTCFLYAYGISFINALFAFIAFNLLIGIYKLS
jgi:hypothetical protein